MNPRAIAAIKEHKIGCFYLWGASVPTWDKYICLAIAYRRIKDRLRTPKPFIYRVTYNYRVEFSPHPMKTKSGALFGAECLGGRRQKEGLKKG